MHFKEFLGSHISNPWPGNCAGKVCDDRQGKFVNGLNVVLYIELALLAFSFLLHMLFFEF